MKAIRCLAGCAVLLAMPALALSQESINGESQERPSPTTTTTYGFAAVPVTQVRVERGEEQPIRGRPAAGRRKSASAVLQGESPVSSLAALEDVLQQGDEVVVTDADRRSRRGRVQSIDESGIVLDRPVSSGTWEALLPLVPPFWWPVADTAVSLKRSLAPSPARRFVEESIERIEIVDSTANGTALGALVGLGLAGGVYLAERRTPDNSLEGIATFFAAAWGIPVSMRIGQVLDRAANAPVFLRTTRPHRVSVFPTVRRDVAAIAIAISL